MGFDLFTVVYLFVLVLFIDAGLLLCTTSCCVVFCVFTFGLVGVCDLLWCVCGILLGDLVRLGLVCFVWFTFPYFAFD